MTDHIRIFEVGPRDGLQNEKELISTQDKIALVDMLSSSGLSHIEVSSFVSPKWVPQMSDAAEVFAGIKRNPDITYAALTPNTQGYKRAIEAHADEVAIFGSASEGFSQKNINCSIEESIERFVPIIEAAKADNVKVRGYVSCVIECPYDGKTNPQNVADLAGRMIDLGCYEISLGDTIGKGTPDNTNAMLDKVLEVVPVSKIAGHFHDTGDAALDNIRACVERGVRVFDAAVGGLGGCPYAKGAKGNVDTVSVVNMLHDMGYSTGVDSKVLQEAATFAKSLRGH